MCLLYVLSVLCSVDFYVDLNVFWLFQVIKVHSLIPESCRGMEQNRELTATNRILYLLKGINLE